MPPREAALFAIEQLVLAKYHMTRQVYAHRVRVITDNMVVRGTSIAAQSNPQIRRVFAYDGTSKYLERYLQIDDAKILGMLLASNSSKARSIFERIKYRRLFKEVVLIPIDRSIADPTLRDKLGRINDSPRLLTRLQYKISSAIGCRPWEVIINKKNIKNPAYYPPGGLDPSTIEIIDREKRIKQLNDFEQEIAAAKVPSIDRVHVIAPVDRKTRESLSNYRKRRKQLEHRIKKLVFESL